MTKVTIVTGWGDVIPATIVSDDTTREPETPPTETQHEEDAADDKNK